PRTSQSLSYSYDFLSHLLYASLPSLLLYSPHHRDLFSFPTRRSSDLRKCFRSCWVDGFSPRARKSSSLAFQRATAAGQCRHCRQDRKSTRLNSSHGSISYAVFCLKKNKASRDC